MAVLCLSYACLGLHSLAEQPAYEHERLGVPLLRVFIVEHDVYTHSVLTLTCPSSRILFEHDLDLSLEIFLGAGLR